MLLALNTTLVLPELCAHFQMALFIPNLPLIFEKVKKMFANLLQNLGTWIRKGWDYLMQIISNGFYYE